jgi:dCMP deaminase
MNWDSYYHEICVAVAKKSNCLSRSIGAILVKDKSIVATGYNGPPRDIPHCDSPERREYIISQLPPIVDDAYKQKIVYGLRSELNKCPRQILGYASGEGLSLCIAAHAERNCLINAARLGVSTLGTTLYLNTLLPCKDCLIELINAGIVEIVCEENRNYNDIDFLLLHSDIRVREFVLDWPLSLPESHSDGDALPNTSPTTPFC